MGKGGETSNKYEPPEWTAGRYPGAMEQVDAQFNKPYQAYNGQSIAGMNDRQMTAGELTTDRALYSDPQTRAARAALMGISQGDAQNPYAHDKWLDDVIGRTSKDMAEAHAEGTAAQTDAAAAMGGAFGGSLHSLKQSKDAALLADRVGAMSNQARSADLARKGQLWQQDVGNQMGAAGMAADFSRLDQESYDALNKFGSQQQNNLQSMLTGQKQDWQAEQDFGKQNVDWLLASLGKASGGYGTNWQGGGGASPWGTAAGLGMAAYGATNGFNFGM